MRSTHLLLLCFIGLLLQPPRKVQACKCLRVPTLLTAFQSADFILQASLIKKLDSSTSLVFAFSAKIIRAWKGCSYFKGVETLTVTANSQGPACGVISLKAGTTYLLSGSFGPNPSAVSVNSCAYQTPWNALNATTQERVATLARSYSNCTCTGTRACGSHEGQPIFLCPDGVSTGGPICTYNLTIDACVRVMAQCPTCQKQSDCRANQFCWEGRCRASGTCFTSIDCWNPAHKYTTANCSGIAKCKAQRCEMDCSNHCPNGGTPIECFATPCSVTSCKEPHVSCASNYCGNCRALFFNSSGYQVCHVNASVIKPCQQRNCGTKPNVARLRCPNGAFANNTYACVYNVKAQACRWKITQSC